ncbi:MAG: hypothetical protein K8T10_05160 [Candidatus Eremiobacteraeota bacterium]|nr:hypothetical protein [Candidatus Eremiobacteraeota bacterium]
MDCDKIKSVFIEYIDENLNMEMMSVVKNHLDKCKSCREISEETREVIHNIECFSSSGIPVDHSHKSELKDELLRDLRVSRAHSPFLSALHRRKEAIKKKTHKMKDAI